MFKNSKAICLSVAISGLCLTAFADNGAAVVDLSEGGGYSSTENNTGPGAIPPMETSSLPLPERVSRLEEQVNNLVQMNLPQQVAELQQQVEKLNGQLQEQTHQLDIMSRQQQHVEALPPQPQSPPPPPLAAAPVNPENPAVPVAPPNTMAPPTAIPPQTDAAAYQAAFNLLATKQWDAAAKAFRDYLRDHPDGQFAPNAHYWLGEIYFQQKNLTQAELELNYVVTQYPASSKVSDAQLKLAILHAQQGKTDQARQELKMIMLRYPGSPAAQLAAGQLQQLNQ